jgi:hypothetical protein
MPTIFRGCAFGEGQIDEKVKAYRLGSEEMHPRKQGAQ